MDNTIVESKICTHCQSLFDIAQQDLDFYNKISPSFAGQKFNIPTPTLCPDCRQRRRMSFRSERKLYRRICDATQQPIISMYNPECGYKVYETKVWYSDSRNPMDFGMDFDFTQSFTQNLYVLSKQIPRPSMYNYFAENSDYCNCSNYQKNCYLTSAASKNEGCMYSSYLSDSSYCLDAIMTSKSENSYMTIDCREVNNIQYANNCQNCSDSYLLTNCFNCNNCFDCDGLQDSSYCFQNQQLTRQEYESKITNIVIEDYIGGRKQRKQAETVLFSEGSTGDHIRNSQNAISCSDVTNVQDCTYCKWFYDSRDCYDIYSWGQESQLCYEAVAIGENNYSVAFCANTDTGSQRVYYSIHCTSCSDCFGCIGLRNKQYCIFNKQYTKEAYEEQVAKIITHMISTGEWGEFFHPSLSPFGYNETVAQEYYPLMSSGGSMTKDPMDNAGDSSTSFHSASEGQEGIDFGDFGYHRSDYEAPTPQSDKVINGSDLPDTIAQVEDSILQYAVKCEITDKLFRITPQELAFYRRHNIPLPRKHPDQRHLERMELRK